MRLFQPFLCQLLRLSSWFALHGLHGFEILIEEASQMGGSLEDPNILKLRSLDSSCPFYLSDNSISGQ